MNRKKKKQKTIVGPNRIESHGNLELHIELMIDNTRACFQFEMLKFFDRIKDLSGSSLFVRISLVVRFRC